MNALSYDRVRQVVLAANRRYRVRLEVYTKRKKAAALRAYEEGIRWERKLAAIRAWKNHCEDQVCPHCGLTYTEKNPRPVLDGPCLKCDHAPKYSTLHRMIQRLAGINPVSRHGVKNEWSDALSGKKGPRGCSQASWENAVRLREDE